MIQTNTSQYISVSYSSGWLLSTAGKCVGGCKSGLVGRHMAGNSMLILSLLRVVERTVQGLNDGYTSSFYTFGAGGQNIRASVRGNG